MKYLVAAAVYLAVSLSSIPAIAGDYADVIGLREGSMKKLIFHTAPQAVSNASFELADERGKATLEDYQGKYVLLNVWAHW